jgi:gamma-glutamyltranspeptidase / glutathione hydrolase
LIADSNGDPILPLKPMRSLDDLHRLCRFRLPSQKGEVMSRLRVAAALLSSFLVLIGVAAAAVAPSGPPTSTGTGGAAASVETLATQAAIDALKRGGNAVDAAVTAAGVLGVAEPFSCGIGGGGFMVIYRAFDGKVTTIDGRETAPAAMTPTSFMWDNGKAPAFTTARYSGMSVGVPGTPATWGEALEKYGTFSLAQTLGPGIALARNGFVVDQVFHDQIAGNQQAFRDVPSSAALYLKPDGTALDAGTVFRNPDLASTYERIAHLGLKGFYRGEVADAIVNTVQNPPVTTTATLGWWHPGVMTMRDLHNYVAPERAPTHVSYHGADVYSMGPPSSGGSTVGEALNILEPYNLGTLPREQALHYYLEASRYAYADRNQYLADPDYVNVPLKGLLSKDYAATRRALIKETAATSPVGWGDPWPYNGGASGSVKVSTSEGEPGQTTHLSVVDRNGNAVSYTFTIEQIGGAGIVVPGFGFLVNNELTDFNFDSTGTANQVEGGKRPRSSMSPTIVLKDGKPFLVLGSPGGATIITTVLQMLVNRLDFGMTLPDALAAPRASQRNSSSTQAEPAFINTWSASLAARGHTFSSTLEIGAATGIEFLGGGRVVAAAEPVRRGGGSALVESPSP